jgi:MoxR-like ATPase
LATKKDIIRDKFSKMEDELNGFLIEREDAIHGLSLALLSKTNLLLLGSPGTAKSMIVKEFSKRIIGSKYFEWLLTRYTTPDELFGPISAKGLKEDKYRRLTEGKLPWSHFTFLDEIFKANSGILNSLLSLANERIFYNDGKPVLTNLLCLVGASNEIPDDDEELGALYDRFHLKYEIKTIQDPTSFLRMLKTAAPDESGVSFSMEEVTFAQRVVEGDVEVSPGMYDMFSTIRKELKKQGISVSDRTYKISLLIAKAEAWLAKDTKLNEGHLEILKHLFWQDPDKIRKVQSTILDITNPEKGKIVEIYNNAISVFDHLKNISDVKKRKEQGVDSYSKLTSASEEVDKLIKKMAAKKKDTTKMFTISAKINDMAVEVMEKHVGITMNLKPT